MSVVLPSHLGASVLEAWSCPIRGLLRPPRLSGPDAFRRTANVHLYDPYGWKQVSESHALGQVLNGEEIVGAGSDPRVSPSPQGGGGGYE